MKKFLNCKFLLFTIVLLAAFLRFYQLGINPPSLTWDEASWGYNAYSLGIDGKDEFGKFLPYQYLESFGDFKPPIYAYLDIIPVKIFGLNEFAVRFPSAFFGVLAVLFTYFLVKRIFWKSDNANKYALFSSFFLAISPWHILLSRAAFEANIASFFIILGVWSFMVGVKEKRWFLIISAFSFVLSMYTFNTARIATPLLVLILTIGFRKELFSIKKQAVISAAFGLIFFLPILGFLLSPQAKVRFQEVNIFSDLSILERSNQEIKNDNNSFWSKIIHNRRLVYTQEYLKHYFDNLKPSFLFISGDENPKFSTQTTGQMYLWDIPFFIAGCLFLFRKREINWWIIPFWLLIGIIPAAVARETPHALRIESSLPTFQIIVAYGFVHLSEMIKRNTHVIVTAICLFLFLNLVYFHHDYYAHYGNRFSGVWQYGYKASIEYVKSVQDKYNYIYVNNVLGRPYIYYLFYNKTQPDYFRKNSDVQRDTYGFVEVRQFGKYLFTRESDHSLNENKKILYINSYKEIPEKAKALKTFYLLNGDPVLAAYTL